MAGLTEAVQDDYDPPQIIYEDETKLPRVEAVLSIGIFILTALTVGTFYYCVGIKHSDHD